MDQVRKNIITCCLACIVWHAISAQVFITNGVLQYQKTVHMHNMASQYFPWMENWKQQMPVTHSENFELVFSSNQSLYHPAGESSRPDLQQVLFLRSTVYTNRNAATYTAQKEILGTTYLVQDSLPHMDWKLTADRRTIAGFECRKAIGRILDSITVIAFYTDEIVPGGGPESFSGLPGMILGVAIPRLHTTWYATALQGTVNQQAITPPSKGQPISSTALSQTLEKTIDNSYTRSYRQLYAWQAML